MVVYNINYNDWVKWMHIQLKVWDVREMTIALSIFNKLMKNVAHEL